MTIAGNVSLRLREKLWRNVLEALPIGVVVIDPDGNFQEINEVGRQLFGPTMRSTSPARRAASIGRALRGERQGEREFSVQLPDGSTRHLLGDVVPLREDDGTIAGAVGMVTDITERKRTEQALQASQSRVQRLESVGLLAGGIAHDFNNLLTVIIGCAEMVLGMGKGGAATKEWEETLAAARRAAELTSQLLAFARQQPIAPRLVDLNAVVTGMDTLLRRVIGEDVRLVVAVDEGTLPVSIDPRQFERILVNLAVNASDAMPSGGTLRVATRRRVVSEAEARLHQGLPAGDTAQLIVSDTGVGIPEAIRGRIFEPFFTTKGAGAGTGLGLSMCYGTVCQAGGCIDVDSTEGVGTELAITLPIAAGDVVLEAPRLVPMAAIYGARILVVEDEHAVADLTRRALELGGYRVTVAHGGADALALLKEQHDGIDLLLTDVVMPGMRGTVLARHVLASHPEVPVLFVSGNPGSLEAEFPGAHLLDKPFTPSELLRHVASALRR